jgi:hypothetical protein
MIKTEDDVNVVEHVSCLREMRNVYRILGGKHEGKIPLDLAVNVSTVQLHAVEL